MQRIAKFYKVSFEQYLQDWESLFGDECDDRIKGMYENIKLPLRATKGSAGYDFFTPQRFTLEPGKTIIIPTGIRAEIQEGWVLQCFPRSGLGFKYRLQLDNTVGIIDSDYFYAENEGHLFVKLTNDSKNGKIVTVEVGTAFMQGVFVPFGITEDDEVTQIRTGGLGSTSK